jgi:CRISPR-associated endonuclease Csn1
MERIFGFDIGTTSIGFAVIDHDPAKRIGNILRLGVRIFPEARDPDGTPLNQQRRQKRMMRRQLRRRRKRRRALNEALCETGLLPAFSKDNDSEWSKLMLSDPYALRKRGLKEKLTQHELGRAFYHLAQLRHFKGRELEDDDPIDGDDTENAAKKKKGAEDSKEEKGSADDKKLKEEIQATHRLLKARNITLGEFLAEKKSDAKKGMPPQERRRSIHAHRSDVEGEFERLWAKQRSA